ncbi:LURP-one-related/scramblase family protein [Sporobacter termitidis]|nr:LURP-one-related family protein [Sporobacter termitidis]
MKLYIQQKVFSWVDRFTVMDEAGRDKYYVEGELFSFGKKLHLYDMAGAERAFIQQKVFSFLPRYFVFVEGMEIAEIVKELTFLRPRYSIEGLGWEINGSFWAHDYEIVQGSRPIVTIHKEWMTWGDCYEMDIADERDEIVALSVVLAIDCVMAAEAAANS